MTAQSPLTTFAEKLAHAKGRPSGFDYLRLFLAVEVLVWHTVLMTQGLSVQNDILNESIFRSIPSLILPMFFALSGFLVAGSLARAENIFDFVCLRLLRIMPALCLVVLVAALVLGPLLTTVSWAEYFSDPRFLRYFRTLFGHVQEELPAVFESNPYPHVVNGQLWTIPLELLCYALLAVLALVGVYRRPKLFLAVFVAAQMAFALRTLLAPVVWGSVPAKILYLCFLAGALLSVYRERIPFRRDAALACGALAFGLMYVAGGGYFIAAPVAYLTIYVGLLNPTRKLIVSSGDYSYGVYLFAFPVQQWVVAMQGGVPPPIHQAARLGWLPRSMIMIYLVQRSCYTARDISYAVDERGLAPMAVAFARARHARNITRFGEGLAANAFGVQQYRLGG